MQPQKSYFAFVVDALGVAGTLMLIASLAVFVGACVVVFGNKRPAVIAAYLVFVPIPILIGIYAAVRGFVNGFAVVTMSDTDLRQSEILGVLTEAALLIQIGMLASVPSYLLTSIGLFVRALQSGVGSPDGQ